MPNTRYIAIVDDHTILRKGLAMLINTFPDYKVLFDAANGKDFISQLHPQHLPEIALLDISMPEMDGYATAEWLRVNHPEINVLALSTLDAETAIIKMIKHGASGYVLKDAGPVELKLAFDDILSKGYFYNEAITRKVMRSINQLADDKNETGIFAKLNDRELEFLKLSCSEKTYRQVAKEMFVSERTVDGYREALFRKLNVTTRVGLALFAVKNNLVRL